MKNLRLFLFINFILFISLNSYSKDNSNKTIAVEGNGKISLTPSIVNFRINLVVEDTVYAKCVEKSLDKIEKIKTLFKQYDIDSTLIKTTSFNIRENNRYDNRLNKEIFLGYSAQIPITIKIDIDNPKTSQIFEIVKNNIESRLDIEFELSKVQMENARNELIEYAIKDAREKAQNIVEDLNLDLGKIIKIQYGEPEKIRNFTHSNYNLYTSERMVAVSAKQPLKTLTPTEIEMTTFVMIAWKIK